MHSIPRQPEEVISPSCESYRALLDRHERQGHSDEAGPHQKLRVLGRHRLCRQLVQAWSHEGSHDRKVTVRVGHHVRRIAWSSKLQTLTALSTKEAEYVTLSSALQDQIPIMQLLKEVIA